MVVISCTCQYCPVHGNEVCQKHGRIKYPTNFCSECDHEYCASCKAQLKQEIREKLEKYLWDNGIELWESGYRKGSPILEPFTHIDMKKFLRRFWQEVEKC